MGTEIHVYDYDDLESVDEEDLIHITQPDGEKAEAFKAVVTASLGDGCNAVSASEVFGEKSANTIWGKSMTIFTVISYDENSAEIFCDRIEAESGESAMAAVAEDRQTSTLVLAIKGELSEQAGDLILPGFGVIEAENYLSRLGLRAEA